MKPASDNLQFPEHDGDMHASLLPDTELPGQRLMIQAHPGSLTWKQKLAFSFPLETGGSWRKSPHTMSWMPPNGSGDLLTDLEQPDLSHPSGYKERHTHTQLPDVISLMLFMVPSVRIVHFLKSHLATASSLSKNWASTMETSSMIRCLQLVQCCSTPGLWASWMHCSREAEPEPIPGKWTRGRNVNRGTKGSMNEQHTCRHPTYSFCILRFN